jgi:predicted HNH restriction endonuclease
MKIILSQKIETASDYEDKPFSIYHFPESYINQIHPGDQFIYHQGNKSRKDQRYYFGCGVIGQIEPSDDGQHYYAEILNGIQFNKVIPIYSPTDPDSYLESIDYKDVRIKPTPAWQNSIRKLSDGAYYEILRLANIESSIGDEVSQIESYVNPLSTLQNLNSKFRALPPKERNKRLQVYLDRGSSVTKALKTILGPKCQICGWKGFEKRGKEAAKNNECFIEAHHLNQVSEKSQGSLCTDNIILVCPNCHREIHYGKKLDLEVTDTSISISLSNHSAQIPKNTIEHLKTKVSQPQNS